jgi:hypothetical protein
MIIQSITELLAESPIHRKFARVAIEEVVGVMNKVFVNQIVIQNKSDLELLNDIVHHQPDFGSVSESSAHPMLHLQFHQPFFFSKFY